MNMFMYPPSSMCGSNMVRLDCMAIEEIDLAIHENLT